MQAIGNLKNLDVPPQKSGTGAEEKFNQDQRDVNRFNGDYSISRGDYMEIMQ